jgi:outer membrane protein assembly factor BamB
MCALTRAIKYTAAAAVVAAAAFGLRHFLVTNQANPEPLGPSAVNADEPKKDPAAITGGKSDHVMFGGTPSRNMVNLIDKDIPGTFNPETDAKWRAQLGSRAYGGPIIAGGKIFCGTNNENPRNKRDRGKATDDDPMGPPLDKGVLMCFDEKTGNFIWQAVHDKLESGIVNDWIHEGLCSTPIVEGDRVYYCSNRCTVVCADVNGFANGNQGVQDEKYKDKTDADFIWEVNMIKDLNVFPHNMTAGSPLIVGDLLFTTTANGVDEGHINLPSPEAPSFLCLSKKTGKVIWKSNAPGKAIMHGQWSNPAYGVIHGVPQVIFTGGDGWLHAFAPDTGAELWKFDANPKDAKYELGGKGTRSDFIGTPVVHNDKVYIGTGQDPEHFEGIGHFWCIEPGNKSGDISPELVVETKDPPVTKPNPNSAVVWHYGGEEKRKYAKRDYVFGRTMSSACIVDDICYISELAGYLHVLDAKTGKKYWQFDLKSAIWGSPYYVDGKIFLGNEDGDLFVFRHDPRPAALDEVEIASKEPDEKAAGKKLIEVKKEVDKKCKIAKIEMGGPIRSTPIVANGVLYIMTENSLIAIGKK